MVDFKKKLQEHQADRKIHPVDIYDTLDRKSVAGPLRPPQRDLLNQWFDSRREDKDLIVKLHTGQGKTLIGLLMLQSRINSHSERCLYVCPNWQLVDQVKSEAQKFGIQVCEIEEGNNIPQDFSSGKKILVTTIQKLFNGRTIFGLRSKSIRIDNIVLDDSHACIDSIRSSLTIRMPKKESMYGELLALFTDELSNQGAGTFLEIEQGYQNSILPVPYWAWSNKHEEALKILHKYSENDNVKFIWPLIKDSLEHCHCIFSGSEVEIQPHNTSIDAFAFFTNARQRILMSATTQDDSFFIKGLGFSIDSVRKPLTSLVPKWSGEKMILIPWLIDQLIDREYIISKLAPPSNKSFGIVALVSSGQRALDYEAYKAKIARSTDIGDALKSLRKGSFTETLVLVNRYDGIDLPDESCRILIVDGLPFSNSLIDRYEENCRETSDIMNVRQAQRIEQGLGRGVRGEKDYCCIILIGGDLIRFIRSAETNKYFSPQTRKQIALGLEIADMGETESRDTGTEGWKVVLSLIRQSLDRNEDWKAYYNGQMEAITDPPNNASLHSLLEAERKAEEFASAGQYERACDTIQQILDSTSLTSREQGWYLQMQARHKHWISVTDSNQLQLSAYNRNRSLLKPRIGVAYKLLQNVSSSRASRVIDFVTKQGGYNELMLTISDVLDSISFGTPAEKFESALMELGLALGFESQRPDNEYKEGPDNLWVTEPNEYIMFECKSEVKDDREDIVKHEGGQMNTHCAWFENKYGNVPVTRILVIPAINMGYATHFTHDVRILRKGKLKELKKSVTAFFNEFRAFKLDTLNETKVHKWLTEHRLMAKDFQSEYSELPRKQKP